MFISLDVNPRLRGLFNVRTATLQYTMLYTYHPELSPLPTATAIDYE